MASDKSKIPNEEILMNNLGKISYTLDRAYLPRLESDYNVLPFDEHFNQDKLISYASNIRALRVKRCVFDQEEKVADCFKNILGLFANSEDSLALVLKRTPQAVEMYFVVKNVGLGRNEESKFNIELLADSILGNLPGTEVELVIERDGGADTERLFPLERMKAVSVLSNVPSEKSEDFVSQGIEKLLNGVVPQCDADSYTVVLLAESLPLREVRDILRGYEELATAITPFSGYQFQVGKNKTETQGEMESLSHSKGISHSINRTHSLNFGVNIGTFLSVAASLAAGPVGGSIARGLNAGLAAGYGYSWGTTDTESTADAKTQGTNHSISVGSSENTTYTYQSYLVSDLITNLKATIKRIDESRADGLWRYAAYAFSDSAKTTIAVTSFLRAISQGDHSHIEPAFTQTWVKDNRNGVTGFAEVQKYVKHFTHPIFYHKKDGTPVTPTTQVSTAELANIFSFPRHAVQALPVIECVRFGREPHALAALARDIDMGCAYHMHQEEKNNRVYLSKDELTKHTFITGSTGSGKSNTIYQLLEKLCPQDSNRVSFLVIEPAKGEYKDVFGGREDVNIYGTNPFKTPNLLQINPFSFPAGVHVLEHIDRLVEVFNACWPMYAAMPAILKGAVEQAYKDEGWNLKCSKNPGRFPTFDTLMSVLPNVIDASAYSADTSNDYKGALLTRVRSLTIGIQGRIFKRDTDSESLFLHNAIIDLSRVGSAETKALIMGILVLKLQEFRMSEPAGKKKGLRHITVLEEAHNLLRRTSSEQSQESSNLQGKSVEMLGNAIAEMRTYGEGFIIADQSPGLMDLSVIRNTNTKIILRLPDESDRILVGKAAGLSDAQISELSRLKCGVAAISQSGWLEPVLCKVDEFTDDISMAERYGTEDFQWEDDETLALKEFWNAALAIEHTELSIDAADEIRQWRDHLSVSDNVHAVIARVLKGDRLSEKQQMLLIGGLFGNRLRTIPDRETAIAEVRKRLIGQYCFTEQDEVIRRVNDLFLAHFPSNIYTDPAVQIEVANGGIL